LHPDRSQFGKRTFNGLLVVLESGRWVIAQTVDRSRPPRRQLNLTSRFQLQQQAAGSHILEPTGAVAPVPSLAQITGQPRPVRVWMGLQPVSNQCDILRADIPPLNDQWSIHGSITTAKLKLSPEKKEKVLVESAALPATRQNQLNPRRWLPSSASK
jgi:hypothetical protein